MGYTRCQMTPDLIVVRFVIFHMTNHTHILKRKETVIRQFMSQCVALLRHVAQVLGHCNKLLARTVNRINIQ
jgi:hypothetical protein